MKREPGYMVFNRSAGSFYAPKDSLGNLWDWAAQMQRPFPDSTIILTPYRDGYLTPGMRHG